MLRLKKKLQMIFFQRIIQRKWFIVGLAAKIENRLETVLSQLKSLNVSLKIGQLNPSKTATCTSYTSYILCTFLLCRFIPELS